MNIDRGLHRLAVFVGCFGAIGGALIAYRVLHKIPSERYQHQVFLRLAGSDIAQWDRKLIQAEKAAGWNLSRPLASDVDLTMEPINYAAGAQKYGGFSDSRDSQVIGGSWGDNPSQVKVPLPPKDTMGIKRIFWRPDFSVDFFEMQDGGFVRSGPSPSAWLYLLWVAYPALGFAALWGTVRSVAWVIAGFRAAPR